MTYRQLQFDQELQTMLRKAKADGQSNLRVLSKDLHDRVVKEDLGRNHRMKMACDAMWKLWKAQGGVQRKIIHTSPGGRSSTIVIEFQTT